MPARKKPPKFPQSSLIPVVDALKLASDTVDVASSALARSEDPMAERASMVLMTHVYEPLERSREVIEAHAQTFTPIQVEALLRLKRRKKRAPNGSRKGKKRQRNRFRDRQKAKKPWD